MDEEWEDAMEEAREYFGYREGHFVKDWEELVETAREIFYDYKTREYDLLCEEAKLEHSNYLKSKEWLKLRKEILKRDKHKCKDCGVKAKDIHHLNYKYLKTKLEKYYCISLCRECHEVRHGLRKRCNVKKFINQKFLSDF